MVRQNVRHFENESLMDFGEGLMLIIDAIDDIGQATMFLLSVPYNKLYKPGSVSSIEVIKNDSDKEIGMGGKEC